MEHRAHPQLDVGQLEDVPLDVAHGHWVTIAHDGGWEPMKADNGIEEGLRDHGRNVGVAQLDEVSMFGEVVHHFQDDAFVIDTRYAFNEIERNVGPNL